MERKNNGELKQGIDNASKFLDYTHTFSKREMEAASSHEKCPPFSIGNCLRITMKIIIFKIKLDPGCNERITLHFNWNKMRGLAM